MPLRDHFRPPLDDLNLWEGVHAQWPAMLVLSLARQLPPGYVAVPGVHHGASAEIDVATFEHGEPGGPWSGPPNGNGGGVATVEAVATAKAVATAVWPVTREVETDLPDTDEYEVRVYARPGRRLVAAVEIVSPANKDRPAHRRAFVAKCAALLQDRVSLAIVDLVTSRTTNLFAELLDLIGQPAPSPAAVAPLYAVACRFVQPELRWRFQTWERPLALGQPLPPLPLWLTDDLAVTLDLEPTYEDTCRVLQIP